MKEIPKSFEEKYRKILPDSYQNLFRFYLTPYDGLSKFIRVNTLKTTISYMKNLFTKKGFNFECFDWYTSALKVEDPKNILSKLFEFFLGFFYFQDLSSMIPPIVLQPEQNDMVLDLCAAPGSKTTQISQMMNNTGLIVANDNKIGRLKSLRANCQLIGCTNTVLTRQDGITLKIKNTFDKVLVDAPCSGTGKRSFNFNNYNRKTITFFHNTQTKLLLKGIKAAKPKGTIVYSTCSLEPEENEKVISNIIDRDIVKIKEIEINSLNSKSGLIEFNGEFFNNDVKKCMRLFPHENESEGFFITKMVKL